MDKKKVLKISGWILTILIVVILGMSALTKLSLNEVAQEQLTWLGIEAQVYRVLGIVEIFALLLFVIPRTGILGSLFLVAYMGGAIATNLILNENLIIAISIEIILWIAMVIRIPEISQRLFLINRIN